MVQQIDCPISPKYVPNWTVVDALREIIANALDEAAITRTADPRITADGRDWVIRDFGRGLRYDHFTQKESDEKRSDIQRSRRDSFPCTWMNLEATPNGLQSPGELRLRAGVLPPLRL